MDLLALMAWTKKIADRKVLKELVKKDKTGQPHEGDITVCHSILIETTKRIQWILDAEKKKAKYTSDVAEYLAVLEARGVVYELNKETTSKSSGSALTAKKELKT